MFDPLEVGRLKVFGPLAGCHGHGRKRVMYWLVWIVSQKDVGPKGCCVLLGKGSNWSR